MADTHPTPICADTKATTSPSHIEGEARSRLRGSSSVVLGTVVCKFHDGILMLLGQLPSYHAKQMAQELVKHIVGVQRIDNRIEVITADSSTWLG